MPKPTTRVAARTNFRTSQDSHGEAASLRKQNAELKAQIEEMEQADDRQLLLAPTTITE